MGKDQTDPIPPVAVRDVPGWDDHADVIVVGMGCAGTCAAIEAAEAGASVLALERADGPGGTSANSGGIIYLGGGTPIQQACGFEDDPENMAAFLMAACGPGADHDKVSVFSEHSVNHYNWLVKHGVPFKAELWDEPNREPSTDAGLLYSGGENTWPFCEIARPAPRGHHPQFPDSAGGFLMRCLTGALGNTSAIVRAGARVDQLVVDEADGDRVVGVAARVDGQQRHLRASRGVVLTGGGFIFNEAMAGQWCPDALRPNPAWRIGTDYDDGQVIRLGQGAGSSTTRMSAFECALPLLPPNRMARGLLVNTKGERYVNEDAYTGRLGYESLVGQGGDVYYIIDEHNFVVNAVGMQVQWAAETIEELAGDIGLPPEALAATLSRYNSFARQGEDPDFHKNPEWVVPLRPPFGAADLRVGSGAVYATFTLGGLATDARAQVCRDGGLVPGLYAAGRTAAGIAAHGYVSGISLGDGTFFGRRAGQSAAASR